MYTNGYTGQKCLTLITVTNAPVGERVLTDREFAAQSEHIEIRTDAEGDTLYVHSAWAGVFTGL